MIFQSLLEEPVVFLLWVLAIIMAITIHEFSHAWSAHIQGDHTAVDMGRLTLNPLSHIDWLGFFLLMVAGFGWAKPTPFNPYNLKFKRFGPALVALAGPASNVLIVVVIGAALAAIHRLVGLPADNLLMVFFVFIIQVNILLAVFNLIPIPPLDGSKVLYTFLGTRRPEVVMFLERYGTWLLLGLVFLGSGIISRIFFFFYNWTFDIIF